MLRSVKTGQNQFVLKGTVGPTNDFMEPKNFFAKRLQELTHCQHYTRNSKSV